MPPAPPAGMLPPEAELPGDAFPPAANEPLVPILRLEDGAGDADALGHLASGALQCAWRRMYRTTSSHSGSIPSRGGVVLLGPEALAQDDLKVPLPSPQLKAQQLTILDEIVHDAGYASAVSLPDSLRQTRRRTAVGREPEAGPLPGHRAHGAASRRAAARAFAGTADSTVERCTAGSGEGRGAARRGGAGDGFRLDPSRVRHRARPRAGAAGAA